MEKLLNLFGLTTLSQAEKSTNKSVNKAIENTLNEKRYASVLKFVRVCRKYKFKVVAVDMDEAKAMECSRLLAKNEFNADVSEQNDFTEHFIDCVKPSSDKDLLF